MSKIRSLSKRSKMLMGALLSLALIFFVASAARAALTDVNSQYRYFEVSSGDVTEVVSTSGTIESSKWSEAQAAVSGTVREILVQSGDSVSANQTLVTLDQSEAKNSYLKAKAEYDQAKADLENVESGQSSTVSSSQSSSNSSGSETSAGSSASSRSESQTGGTHGSSAGGSESKNQSATMARLKQAQKQVKSSQTAATTAMETANKALKQQVVVCGAELANDGSDEGASQVSDECQETLNNVQAAQEEVSKKQTELQQSLDSLINLLVQVAKETEVAAKELAKQSAGNQNSNGGQPSGSTGSGSSTSSDQIQGNATSSAASLAQAQAQVDSAKASLVEARENLDATVIRAPRAGKIAGVEVSEGAQVSAGDSVAVVVGNGGAVVTLTLNGTTVKQVKAGQRADVTVIGSTEPLVGKVSWVSPVSSATSSFPGVSSNASYTATIEVPKSQISSKAFPQGVRVDVSIEVGSAQGTLIVPNSALSSRSNPTVQVLNDGETSTTNIEVGLMGVDVAQVTGGIEAGQKVVLADLDAEIDAAGEVTTNSGPGGMGMPRFRGSGGGGIPGGAGFPGGGGRGGR